MLNPSVFSTVVRPCLADYRGWAIISGTSNGDDHFHELKKKNYKDDSWDFFIIPVNAPDALHPDEVVEMTKDMTPEEYAREMLCSFDAPIEGSYYGNLMNDAALQGRVTKVPYDPSVGVITWWDLGIDDAMAVWFVQIVGKSVQIIRYQEYNGKGLDYVAKDIKTFGYDFQAHVFPHDVSAREIGTGRTRLSVAQTYLDNCIVCPKVAVEDGINAVKTVIPMCYFDEVLTADGISAMKNYHRTKKGQPDHNWASHGADAFRYGSVSFNMVTGFVSSNVVNIGGRLHRKIRGVR
jgi:phage terminase large subunit